MQRFKNILLVLDGADLQGPATQRALNLAQSNQAKLTIIDVLPTSHFDKAFFDFSIKIKSLHEELVNERQEEIAELVSHCLHNVDVVIKVLSGKPFVEIIRYVVQYSCDLVIKAVDKEKFTSMLFGTTDFRLLRKCPCPLWIVKPDDHAHTKKILAAIELEPFDTQVDLKKMNQQILEIATSLAYRESGEVHIVNAWLVVDGEHLAKKLSKHYEKDVFLWVKEQKKTIEIAQRDLRDKFVGYIRNQGMENVSYSFHFIEGEAEHVITSVVEREEIDLVVMGTVARTDLAGLLLGNTSEAVLHQINSSVLAVKPQGFTSPITLENG